MARNKRLAKPAERKARHRNANLCGGKVEIEMRDYLERNTRATVSFRSQRFDLGKSYLDDCEFCRDEKAVQKNDEQDNEDVKKVFQGRSIIVCGYPRIHCQQRVF
jgi:hypothetical protein